MHFFFSFISVFFRIFYFYFFFFPFPSSVTSSFFFLCTGSTLHVVLCTTPLYIRKTAFLLLPFFFSPFPQRFYTACILFHDFLWPLFCVVFILFYFYFSPLVSFPLSSCLCFKIYCYYYLVFLFFLSWQLKPLFFFFYVCVRMWSSRTSKKKNTKKIR